MLLLVTRAVEGSMVREKCRRKFHRLSHDEQLPMTDIARRLDLDRKIVRRPLRQAAWQPFRRPARTDTLLAEHESPPSCPRSRSAICASTRRSAG